MSGPISFTGTMSSAGKVLESHSADQPHGVQLRVGERFITVLGLSPLEVRGLAAAGLFQALTITIESKPMQ